MLSVHAADGRSCRRCGRRRPAASIALSGTCGTPICRRGGAASEDEARRRVDAGAARNAGNLHRQDDARRPHGGAEGRGARRIRASTSRPTFGRRDRRPLKVADPRAPCAGQRQDPELPGTNAGDRGPEAAVRELLARIGVLYWRSTAGRVRPPGTSRASWTTTSRWHRSLVHRADSGLVPRRRTEGERENPFQEQNPKFSPSPFLL